MPGFVKVANEVYTRFERPMHVYVACRLYHLGDMHRWRPFECSDRYLMERGPSKRDVRTVVKALISLGFLTVVDSGDRNNPRVIQMLDPGIGIADHQPDHLADHQPDHGNDENPLPFGKTGPHSGPHAGPHSGPKYQTTDKTTDTDSTLSDDAVPTPAALTTTATKALTAAGLISPAACAALTRSELLARPGIGPATVEAVAVWLATLDLELRPERPKKVKPDAKPFTDIWAAVWLARRGTKYQFGDWWKASQDALAFADSVRGNLEEFRRCVETFHGWIDDDDWKANPATLERARYKAVALMNEGPTVRRGEYTKPTPEQLAFSARMRERILRERGGNR
jgi:hypothetical protein